MNRMKLGPLAGLIGSVDFDSEIDNKNDEADDATGQFSLLPDNTPILSDSFPGDSFPCSTDHSAEIDVDGECRHLDSPAVYSCFLPVHYQSNHAYPLVIWLHSSGSNHRQLDSVMPMISDRNYVGASLAGCQVINGADRQFGWLQSSNSIERVTNQLESLIDSVCQRFNINRQRIFIAGQGSGGTMAYRVAFEHPELFAGVISVNGSLPSSLNPLSNWRSCRSLPIFWVHGRDSEAFPETNLCHQLRLLHVAGFDVTLRQYPGDDHLPNQVYGDANSWMMEQIAKQGATVIG